MPPADLSGRGHKNDRRKETRQWHSDGERQDSDTQMERDKTVTLRRSETRQWHSDGDRQDSDTQIETDKTVTLRWTEIRQWHSDGQRQDSDTQTDRDKTVTLRRTETRQWHYEAMCRWPIDAKYTSQSLIRTGNLGVNKHSESPLAALTNFLVA